MSRRHPVLGLATGGLLLLALATCGPAASSPPSSAPSPAANTAPSRASSGPQPTAAASRPATSPALQQLIDAARQEGSLSFIWGDGTLGGSDGVRRLAEGFNRYYDLHLDVKFTPGPSMPNMAARTAQEFQAGRPASTDLLAGYANHIRAVSQIGGIEAVDWAAWAPNLQDPRLISAQGMAVAYQSSTPGITYNTNRVSGAAVPRTLQDLLKPEYKGRLASTPYAASFDQISVPEVWGQQRTLEFARALAAQSSGLIRCNEMDRLAGGEFDLFAIACSQTGTLDKKAEGAPLELVIPADAPLLVPLYVAVPKNSAHPAAAKLWVNYMMGREGQDLIYQFTHGDSHIVPGSKTANDIEQMQGGGLKFTQVDFEFYERHDEDELNQLLTEVQRILQQQ
jgi:ABC-type Fe3+ transport system substrate-binding protein